MDTKKLRQKILDLAIHGKLVPQDPNDEPASVLLERIRAEKERLVKEGKIKKSKASKTTDTPHYENVPFEVPDGWVWTTVENICSKIGSGSTPKGSNYVPDGILFFRSQNVYNDGVVLEDIKYISEEVHQTMIGTEVLPNDLLLNITGGSLGRCAIVPNDINRGNVSQHVCILRPIIVNAEYLHIFILSSFFAKTMKITGSGREGLPKYNLEKMLLPLPPIKEQTRIIHELNKWIDWVKTIEENQQDLVGTIRNTKNKILDLAIHGKLVPQDENDEPASELLKRINPKAEITCDNGLYGKVPNGWRVCKLNDLCSKIFAGGDKPAICTKDFTKENSIPIYANSVENEGLYGYTNQAIVNVPSITISARGTIGFVCVRTQPFVPIVRLITIIPYKDICLEYLSYALQACILTIEGSSIPQLTVPTFKENQIPLPPLAEQHRIVTKIEELFSSLDKIQKSLGV